MADALPGMADIERSAVISTDGAYRYRLTRSWGTGPTMVFVMLNPSVADADRDDPTLRRCIGFAKREGCANLVVVNRYAYRTKDPQVLTRAGITGTDIRGPRNEEYVEEAVRHAAVVVVGWGGFDFRRPICNPTVLPAGVEYRCLGYTDSGAPRHPLYRARTHPLLPWPAP